MSRLDDLLPDQRAALSLLMRERMTYAKVAALLGIEERAVRDRAQAALAVLAPRQARPLSAEQRERIGEYLLDQHLGLAERLETGTDLMNSAQAREWASAISAELAPLAAGAMPEIPDATAADGARSADPGAAVVVPSRPASALARPARRTVPALPSSRRAGALLLAAIAAAVVILFRDNGRRR
jgi:hypothetical protein